MTKLDRQLIEEITSAGRRGVKAIDMVVDASVLDRLVRLGALRRIRPNTPCGITRYAA